METSTTSFVPKKGQRFISGKYKSKLVSDILITDPTYVNWVLQNSKHIISTSLKVNQNEDVIY